MRTLSKAEVETIALKVAAILRTRVDGDPTDFRSWLGAGDGICEQAVLWDTPREYGCCVTEQADCMDAPNVRVVVLGRAHRPAFTARALIHELSHAVLRHFAPETFGDVCWLQVAYPHQATERICRAVERCLLGAFGRCDLPPHGFYWH